MPEKKPRSPQRAARQAEARRLASELGDVEPTELTKVGGNGLRHLIESKQQVLMNPRGVLEELQKAMARAVALQELLEQKVAELVVAALLLVALMLGGGDDA